MSIFGVNGALAGAYQYAASKDVNKADTKGTNFIEQLQETSTSKVDAYTEYLKSKYGKVTIQSIGKDQASLDRAGKSMSGGEVVIAPNILEQMANDYQQKQAIDESVSERTRQNVNVQDIYEAFKSTNPLMRQEDSTVSDEEVEQVDGQESETKTEIIVKPDGSRVLVMTMSIGGMETTMSLEISKPTEAPNENSKQDTDNNMPSADAEMDTASDEMSNISTEA